MAGLLFDRGVSPLEIEKMNYQQMKYWSEWAKAFNERDRKNMKNLNAGKR